MILHLYFARRFFMSFLIITGVLAALVMLVDGVDQARRFADDDVGWDQVLGMTLLHMPQTINMILPLIMILATVALFIGLARSSELVVTRAAGRSALRALVAPVVVALIIGTLAVAFLNPIVAATIELDTPGVSTVNYSRLPYRHLRTPIWPIDADMEWSPPE